MSLMDFAVQVWKGAGLLLGTGLLLYFGIAVAKTILQEVETICEVLILLITKLRHQTAGAFGAMKRLWKVVATFKTETAGELPPGDVPAVRSRSG